MANNTTRSNYARNGNARNARNTRYAQTARHTNNDQNERGCLSSLTIVTVIVIIVTVIIFIAAFNLISSGMNKKNAVVSFSDASRVQSQGQTVIEFNDDDELSSEESSSEESSDVSSKISRASFNGTWKKTNVYESAKATLSVTNQNDAGFDFTLKIWTKSKSESISGTASFTGSKTAVYKKGSASITFELGSKYLSVYHSGKNSTLGLSSSVTIDGKFTTGTPNYYKEKETNTYDYNVYKSSAVVKALKSTLSADDYDLYTEMMDKGLMSPIAYERTVDKNGKKINVDTELKCVKYYAALSNLGMNMVMICSNNGKIYVLFYDVEEMRYYSNDKNYSSKMPKSFQNVADSKGMQPIFK